MLHTLFCLSSTFISNTKLKLAKQHPEAELLLFGNYLLSSSTLRSKNNRADSKKCAKKQVCLFVYFSGIIWLIIMKVKTKSRSHKHDINRLMSRHGLTYTKGAFTCNRDEISSWDETRHGMKKFLFKREFHPRMKRVEIHPGIKFNLKENLPLSMKTYNEIYYWYVKTSDDYFFRKVTLFIIFVCLFSY